MNKQEFIKMIEPFATPEMQNIMGEDLEILYPNKHTNGVKIHHKLLFVDDKYLIYSTDKEHYFFKFEIWHENQKSLFNSNLEWGDGKGYPPDTFFHFRDYPLSKFNDGAGWNCSKYQIIPKNYLLEYFGIGSRFMNWKTNPWEAKS